MEKPDEPSGPFGALTTVKRGALSSMELILMREIKRSVRQLGFPIAVRPLPKGMPIGASRHGSDSLSE